MVVLSWIGILASCGCSFVSAINSYAEVTVPQGNYIKFMSGKMNVPNKPQASSQGIPGIANGAMYLWPGLDPYGEVCGLFQPVLGYSDNHGEWWIANWFSHCPGVSKGYCSDSSQTVYPGDEISFWFRQVAGMNYEMGWQSPRNFSKVQYPCHSGLPRSAWLTEVETYLPLGGHPENEKYMPTSPFRVWDVQVGDRNSYDAMHYNQVCKSTNEKQLSCDWNGRSFVETFPYAVGSSPSPSPSCQDRESAANCGKWKSFGYCDPSSQYFANVKNWCQKTCKLCDRIFASPRFECNGNKACESVSGQMPGGLVRSLAALRGQSANASGLVLALEKTAVVV